MRTFWLALAALLVLAASASADVYEAERLRVVRGKASVVRTGDGRALRLRRPVALRLRATTSDVDGLALRARGRDCRLRVRVGSGRALSVRVRSRRWRTYSLRVRVPGGTNAYGLAFDGARGRCRPYVDLDWIRLRTQGPPTPVRAAPTPTPTPSSTPAPPPPNEPPPPEPSGLPPSPLSPLLPDPQRSGPVPLGAAVFFSHAQSDADYRAAFLREFAVLTPENEMKMERLQPREGQFSFGEADAFVDFAQANGKSIHGHTLVWHGQLPSWVTNADWTADELTEVMRAHIQTVVGRYRGRVPEWDVVNEPFNPDGSYRDNVWHRVIGPSYIEKALRFARAADPAARLYINEIGAEVSNPQSDALFHLVETYRLLGVPIDGIGFQNHTNHNGYPRRDALMENFRRFASLGLDVQVTEMDVAAAGSPDTLNERLTAQSAAFRDAAEACWYVPACKRFTVWGVSDKYSWIGAHEIPLLLDDRFAPKPALTVVRDALDG